MPSVQPAVARVEGAGYGFLITIEVRNTHKLIKLLKPESVNKAVERATLRAFKDSEEQILSKARWNYLNYHPSSIAPLSMWTIALKRWGKRAGVTPQRPALQKTARKPLIYTGKTPQAFYTRIHQVNPHTWELQLRVDKRFRLSYSRTSVYDALQILARGYRRPAKPKTARQRRFLRYLESRLEGSWVPVGYRRLPPRHKWFKPSGGLTEYQKRVHRAGIRILRPNINRRLRAEFNKLASLMNRHMSRRG